jgi:hypothetical protein
MNPWFVLRAPVALSILACALTACGGDGGGSALGGATAATGTAAASSTGSQSKTDSAASSSDTSQPNVSYAP